MYGLQKIASARFDEVIKNLPPRRAFVAIRKAYRNAINSVPSYRHTPEQEELSRIIDHTPRVDSVEKRKYYQEAINKYKKPLRDAEKHMEKDYTFRGHRTDIPVKASPKKNSRHAKYYSNMPTNEFQGIPLEGPSLHVRFGGTELGPTIKVTGGKYRKYLDPKKTGHYDQSQVLHLDGVTIAGGYHPNDANTELAHTIAKKEAIDGYRASGTKPYSYVAKVDPKYVVVRGNHYVVPKEHLKHLKVVSRERLNVGEHPHN